MSYRYSGQIFNERGWTLESWGNGAAYTLRRTFEGGESHSCFIQGDDAISFRERFDSIDEHGGDMIAFLFVDYALVMDLDSESFG